MERLDVDRISERLKRLRLAYGYQQSAAPFARLVGISERSWNRYEKGRRRIELEQAMKVVSVTGASLDWIYRGIEHSLPLDLARKLQFVDQLLAGPEATGS